MRFFNEDGLKCDMKLLLYEWVDDNGKNSIAVSSSPPVVKAATHIARSRTLLSVPANNESEHRS